MNRPAFWSVIAAGWILCLSAAAEEPTAERLAEYQSNRPKSVVALQQFRDGVEIPIRDSATNGGIASLTNLNPHINTWYLLSIQWESAGDVDAYHLESVFPDRQRLVLDSTFPTGLEIETEGERVRCDLWSNRTSGAIAKARAAGEAFAPLCGGRLYLRNPTTGHKTSLELGTDLLAAPRSGGEAITAFVREEFYQDKFLSTAELLRPEAPAVPKEARLAEAPAPPLMDPRSMVSPEDRPTWGSTIENEMSPAMQVGRWYRVREQPGMFISVTQPRFAAPEVVALQKGLAPPLDEVEPAALVYLIAFDLGQLRLDFALGHRAPERGLVGPRSPERPATTSCRDPTALRPWNRWCGPGWSVRPERSGSPPRSSVGSSDTTERSTGAISRRRTRVHTMDSSKRERS